jgi:hippurate hydrolase
MPVKNRFAELHDQIAAWRQDFHTHPELMFDTHRTAKIVADKLREFGCDEVVEGLGRTGVVGVIKGRKSDSGRVVGLRADMDALPIQEATGVPYSSSVDGAMHACGHDGHTAMLLGAAQYLAETRNFDGTAIVVFQPAEEGGGGGREMVDDGLIETFGIQEIYGMHNMPGMPIGQFAIRPGPFFAAADQFRVVIKGRGGHAAKPHETVDAVLVASHVVLAVQSIVSRSLDPTKELVVSITTMTTDSSAHNVIAGAVEMSGTVRTLDDGARDLAERRFTDIVQSTAATFGATADIHYQRGYPVMVNSSVETDYAAEIAQKVSGQCDKAPLFMGGEDFAFMLNKCPGAYILVGNGESAPVHHPEYNFDDAAIPAGCSYWAEVVETRMALTS